MKKFLLAAIGLFALAAPVRAADLPPKPFYKAPAYVMPYNWSGFYLGAVGGGGWADSSHSGGGVNTGDFSQNGGTVGGTVGYNWQAGTMVFGLEGDLSWANITGSTTACPTSCFTNIRSFDTARGRIGMAFDNWLPFITAGAAIANIDAGQSGLSSGNDTRLGATVGAGIEWMFAQNWSAKAEYLYATFNSNSTYATPTSINVAERNVNLLRLGVDYHFNY
jgi:outer membrane immunogenic protein